MKNGEGVYTFADGSVYKGNFNNDMIHGYGLFSYRNGDKYEGNFLKGLRHG